MGLIKLKKGDKIEIERDGLKYKLTSNSIQTVELNDLLKQFDAQFNMYDAFEKEFLTGLFRHKKRQKNKIRKLFETTFTNKISPDSPKSWANQTLLNKLIKALRKIREDNEHNYNVLRRNLIRESSGDSFWGFIFEILFAGNICMSKIKYTALVGIGMPDFKVKHLGQEFKVECTSVQPKINSIKNNEPKYLIGRNITKKENKKYATNNAVLIVDLSSMLESFKDYGYKFDPGTCFPESSKFAAIIFSLELVSKVDGKIFSRVGYYIKSYCTNNNAINNFIEILFPRKTCREAIDSFVTI